VRPYRLLEQPKFRAAFDFLQLRAESGGADPQLVKWWADFQEADEVTRRQMTAPPKGNKSEKPRRNSNRFRSRSKQKVVE
jgi:poly(A) polymerase